MGGAWFSESFGDVDKCNIDAIVDTAVKTVADHLHINERPFRVIPHVHKVLMKFSLLIHGCLLSYTLLAANLCILYKRDSITAYIIYIYIHNNICVYMYILCTMLWFVIFLLVNDSLME
jgi:hypothetical protein